MHLLQTLLLADFLFKAWLNLQHPRIYKSAPPTCTWTQYWYFFGRKVLNMFTNVEWDVEDDEKLHISLFGKVNYYYCLN